MGASEGESRIARLFGLECIRTGRQSIRDERGWRAGELLVVSAWHAEIMPSHHPRAQIAVVRTTDSKFRGREFPATLRGGLLVEGSAGVVADLTDDPLPAALVTLDLRPRESRAVTLDGIGYQLWLHAAETNVALTLHNPREPQWAAVESALFQVASAIASASGSAHLVQYVGTWKGYGVPREAVSGA